VILALTYDILVSTALFLIFLAFIITASILYKLWRGANNSKNSSKAVTEVPKQPSGFISQTWLIRFGMVLVFFVSVYFLGSEMAGGKSLYAALQTSMFYDFGLFGSLLVIAMSFLLVGVKEAKPSSSSDIETLGEGILKLFSRVETMEDAVKDIYREIGRVEKEFTMSREEGDIRKKEKKNQ